MTPICKLARSAWRDLQEVSDYWTSEIGEKQALQVVGGVMETLVAISGHPRAGVVADQFGAGVRKFPAGRYRSITAHIPRASRFCMCFTAQGIKRRRGSNSR